MAEAMLRIERISKRFGGLLAVDEMSFAVNDGEAVGIIGPNGAGKSTLFNLVSGFEQPSAGEVRFMGERVTGLPPHLIARRGLVRTFQNLRPIPGLTVLENLLISGLGPGLLGRRGEMDEARARALDLAARVGLSAWTERGVEGLPYGILKRLEVGRALMLHPKLLMLDEPFAGLGEQESEDLLDVVAELGGAGATLVIIEHKLRMLMRIAERVLVLNYGELIADGPPQAIANDAAVQEAYLGRKGSASLA